MGHRRVLTINNVKKSPFFHSLKWPTSVRMNEVVTLEGENCDSRVSESMIRRVKGLFLKRGIIMYLHRLAGDFIFFKFQGLVFSLHYNERVAGI